MITPPTTLGPTQLMPTPGRLTLSDELTQSKPTLRRLLLSVASYAKILAVIPKDGVYKSRQAILLSAVVPNASIVQPPMHYPAEIRQYNHPQNRGIFIPAPRHVDFFNPVF